LPTNNYNISGAYLCIMKIHVLFVCLGNICRSPLAEGVFRKLVLEAGLSEVITCDSAATSTYEIGNDPDHRTRRNAELHGISLNHKAQQISLNLFNSSTLVLGMEPDNLLNIHKVLKLSYQVHAKIQLLRDFDPQGPGNVPDPYFATDDAPFEQVFTMIDRSCRGLLNDLVREYKLIGKQD